MSRPYLRHLVRELARGAFIASAALAAIYALAKWWGLW